MSADESTTTQMSGTDSNDVNIRVIALAHATNQNEDIFLVTSIDTTIHQLKERLQEKLHHSPRPENQRLIYQGRPLIDGSATLRQILRIDPTTTTNPPAHVLHLVIRDVQTTLPTSTTESPVTQTHDNSIDTVRDLMRRAVEQGHLARTSLFQRHADLQNYHQNAHMQHANLAPNATTNATMPPFMHAQHQSVQRPRAEGDQAEISSQPPLSGAGVTFPDYANITLQNSANVFPNGATVRIHETIGPNGERVRTIEQNASALPGHMVPVERSASAPGSAAHSSNSGLPGRHEIMPPSNPPALIRAPLRPFPGFQQPVSRMSTMPTNQTNLRATPYTNSAGNTTVFLASSPAGPQALLFAPNHGYFLSDPTLSAIQMPNRIQPRDTEAGAQPPNISAQPNEQTRAPLQHGDPGRTAPRAQAAAQMQAQPQAGRREGEEVVALILQRGWLFLRLYMFIFVLSEPGTWRRYILLSIASLVCVLPRQNPFTDLFQAARRHFDSLIGPTQPPRRFQGAQGTGQQDTRENAGTNATTNVAGLPRYSARMPTPAEHARRLLQNHEERNPSVVRETIYRVEQAVALFLASLIPGVGERHVRAREEARRIAQEEAERDRQEQQERNEQRIEDETQKSGSGPSVSDNVSVSQSTGRIATTSGADTGQVDTGSDSTLRMRSAVHESQAPSSS